MDIEVPRALAALRAGGHRARAARDAAQGPRQLPVLARARAAGAGRASTGRRTGSPGRRWCSSRASTPTATSTASRAARLYRGRRARRAAVPGRARPLVRAVRAGKSCCSATRGPRDLRRGDRARRRAERSHVVITNHAFALARQSFFKRVIFDECEHLHDQAHAAFSHTLALAIGARAAPAPAPARPADLARARSTAWSALMPADDSAAAALERCLAAWYATLGALGALQAAIDGYKAWREGAAGRARRARGPRPAARVRRPGRGRRARRSRSRPSAPGPARARSALFQAATELAAALAAMASEVESLPARGMPQLRRALELDQQRPAGSARRPRGLDPARGRPAALPPRDLPRRSRPTGAGATCSRRACSCPTSSWAASTTPSSNARC